MHATVKVWDKEAIQTLITHNDQALARAVIRIYELQTTGERVTGTTAEHNGLGFTAIDAPFLSSIASKLPHHNMSMTPRQIAKVRPMMRKYWKQLLQIIEREGRPVSYRARPGRAPVTESSATKFSSKQNASRGAWGSY